MSDKPAPWTLPADAATYWHDMYSEAAARIEALESALRTIADYSENGDFGPAWDEIEEARKIARAALDKDAGQ